MGARTKPRKPGSGGFRPGAGLKAGELGVKLSLTLRIYASDRAQLIARYGGLQAAFDAMCKVERERG